MGLCAGFIKVFLPHSKIMELVYAGIGAAIFSVYLVVDIQMLMDGKRMQISPDDYILASINLYLDVLNVCFFFFSALLCVNDTVMRRTQYVWPTGRLSPGITINNFSMLQPRHRFRVLGVDIQQWKKFVV